MCCDISCSNILEKEENSNVQSIFPTLIINETFHFDSTEITSPSPRWRYFAGSVKQPDKKGTDSLPNSMARAAEIEHIEIYWAYWAKQHWSTGMLPWIARFRCRAWKKFKRNKRTLMNTVCYVCEPWSEAVCDAKIIQKHLGNRICGSLCVHFAACATGFTGWTNNLVRAVCAKDVGAHFDCQPTPNKKQLIWLCRMPECPKDPKIESLVENHTSDWGCGAKTKLSFRPRSGVWGLWSLRCKTTKFHRFSFNFTTLPIFPIFPTTTWCFFV